MARVSGGTKVLHDQPMLGVDEDPPPETEWLSFGTSTASYSSRRCPPRVSKGRRKSLGHSSGKLSDCLVTHFLPRRVRKSALVKVPRRNRTDRTFASGSFDISALQ